MMREVGPFFYQLAEALVAPVFNRCSHRLKTGATRSRFGLALSVWFVGIGVTLPPAIAQDPPPAEQPAAGEPGTQPTTPATRGPKKSTRRDATGRKPPINRPASTQPGAADPAAGAPTGDGAAAANPPTDGNVPTGETPEVDLQKRLQQLQQEAAQQQAAALQAGQVPPTPPQPAAGQPFNPLGQAQPNPAPAGTPPGEQPNPNNPMPGQPAPGQPQPGQPGAGNPAVPSPNPATPAPPARARRNPARSNTPGAANPPGAQPTEQPQIPALPADMGQPLVEPPSGPTTQLDIPATGGEAPESKTYRFSIKDGTYEALVTAFSRLTGLGVVGDAPKDGKVNFVTTEELSFDEMLNRVRMLLFNYKPHEPYWLERQDKNLLVIRVNDFYRILPRNRMFPSVEAMLDANLKDEELALVIYTPKSGSVADLQQVRDFLPDYMRVTPLEDRNQLTLFALVKDIKKYLELIDFFGNGHFDPRKTERIPIVNLLPSEALEKLRLLIELDAQGRPPRAAPLPGVQRGRGDSASPIIVMQEPPVVTIPEDMQGYILIRAMPDKIEEIKAVLPYIDVELSHVDPIMAIVRVHNAEPAEMIATVQQILGSGGSAGSPALPAPGGAPAAPTGARRPKRAAAANLGAAGPDQATMIPHPTEAAIIVLASSKDDVARVQELVAKLDVPSRVRPIYIAIEHVDPQDTAQSLSQILGGGGGKPGKPPMPDRFALVSDPRGAGLWYTGSEKDLEQVRELLKVLDVPSDPASLHTYRLTKRRPSFIANMLREFEGSTPQPRSIAQAAPPQTVPAGKGRKEDGGGPGPQVLARAPIVASKFTSDDEEMRLFVLCTETEWKHYIPIIEELERQMETPGFRKIALHHVDPETAIARLGDMMGAIQNASGTVRLVPSAGTILVINATEAQYDQMTSYMAEVDRASNVEERTFEIVHRDPAEVKAALEALLLGNTSGVATGPGKAKGRRGGELKVPIPPPAAGQPGQPNPVAVPGASPSEPPTVTEELTIVQIASKLVVRTSPEMMKKVATIVAEFDVDDAKMDIRTYQFPPGTDVVFIAESLRSVVGDGGGHRPAKQTGAVTDAPKIIPQPASGKLIVIADPDLYDDIDLLVKLLQADVEADPVEVTVIPVHHADPADLVDTIEPVLAMKVRDLVRSGDVVELSETPPVPGVPADKQAQGGAQRKRGPRPGSTGERYHLLPSPRLGGIVVAAPRKIADVARELILQFDRVGKEDEQAVVETVDIINTDAPTMVRAIREMLTGVSQPRAARVGRTAGKPEAGGVPATPQPITEAVPAAGLTIVEAPSGGAVILRGLRTDVDQAKAWIKQLDAMTVRGRSIRVFQIQTADIKKLVDLVLNVVDAMEPKIGGGPQVPPPQRAAAGKKGLLGADEESEDDEFVTSKTWTGHDIYIQADFLSNILLVASTAPKLTQIEQIIAQFDTADVNSPVSPKQTSVPHRMFELKFADASDVAWDAEKLFEKLWDPKDQAPKVDSAGIGNSLIVSSMDDSRWDEIEVFIRDNIDKPDPKKTDAKTKSYTPPKGLTAEQAAVWLKIKHPEFDIHLKDISETRKDYGLKQLKPVRQGAAVPCVLPRAFSVLATSIGNAVFAQQEPEPDEGDDDGDQEPIHEPPPVIQHVPMAPPVHEGRSGDQIIRDAVQPTPTPGKGKEKGSLADGVSPKESSTSRDKEDGERSSKLLPGQSVKVNYDSTKGVFVIDAPQWVLDEFKESIKDLEGEVENFPEQADIRIYRVRHIDVFTAQDIIEELFNATKAQRGAVQQQQQQIQAQQRAQQAQGQRQPEQGKGAPEKPGQGGQPGKGGQPGQPTPQQLAQQQQQMNMPQLPPAGVRVYPNPRDRTLIFRAESSQYPAIEELLATIDQPKPVDSELRIFKLKKLNAADVEEVLKELLGLSEKPVTRSAPRAGAAGQPGGGMASSGPGSTLPQSVLTPSISGEEMLNVDPDDIKLTANEEANTIVVMAPKAAITYIEKMIERLEAEDIPERITKYYDLKHANADDVADYLQTHFEQSTSGGGGRRASRGAANKEDGPSPARSGKGGLNAPAFFPYARLNLLTVQATSEQIAKVDDIVARLDAESTQEEWKDVALFNADAKLVAETLSQMFGEGSGGTGARGKSSAGGASPSGGGASAFGGGSGAKFIGEDGGRVVLFRAPLSQHEPILTAIKKLDDEAAKATAIHVLTLKNAMPSKVAEAIEGAYGIRGGAGGGGGGGAKKPIAGQLTITAHDPTRKLFVRSDEKTFKEIESLVTTLDGQRSVGFEFRIYPLKYANARDVHTTLTALVTKYLQQLGQSGSKDIEPFSVEVNDQANALVVLGGPVVFGFMEENLVKIDNPTAGDQRVVQQITLTTADSTAVAKSLTDIFITPMQQKQGATGSPPISISAVQGSQTILVSSSPAMFEKIEAMAKQLDSKDAAAFGPQIIYLKHAKAAQLLPAIQQTFAAESGRGKTGQPPPAITANEAINALIVRSGPADVEAIRSLVATLDAENVALAPRFKVIQIAPGLNVTDLAEKVETTINEIGKSQAGAGRGGQPVPSIAITPDTRTGSLIVSGSSELFAEAEQLAKTIEEKGPRGETVLRVVPVSNVSLEEIQAIVDRVTSGPGGGEKKPRPSGGSRKSRPQPTAPSPGRP